MCMNALVSVLVPWCRCEPMVVYGTIAMSLGNWFLILTQSSYMVFTALCLLLNNTAALSRYIDWCSAYSRLGCPVLLRVRYMVQPWDFETWCACRYSTWLRDCDGTLTFKRSLWCHKHPSNYWKINQWSPAFLKFNLLVLLTLFSL